MELLVKLPQNIFYIPSFIALYVERAAGILK